MVIEEGQPDPGSLPTCCPFYHQAVELIGRRWTGAIVGVLMQGGALRFCEISAAVPQLSDRLLSQRMKELEGRGVVQRVVRGERPVRVEYTLTEMGLALEPAVRELEQWARRWLALDSARSPSTDPAHAAGRRAPA